MSDVKQVGGDHYNDDAARCPHCGGAIQHWDLFGLAPGLIYASTKYLARIGRKTGEDTLTAVDKAISYLQKYRITLQRQLARERGVPDPDQIVVRALGHPEVTAERIVAQEWQTRLETEAEAAVDAGAVAARVRADEYANRKNISDVPAGWVLEEVHGKEGWYHYRMADGGIWSAPFLTRELALHTLKLHLERVAKENDPDPRR